MIDIETCDNESTAIVASVAIVDFNLGKKYEFNDLLKSTKFVKFNIHEQKSMGRTVGHETMAWWKKQSPEVFNYSFLPDINVLSVSDGLKEIKKYMYDKMMEHGKKSCMMWARGNLDSMCLDSLSRYYNIKPIAPFNMWMDVRTVITCMKDSATSFGYCNVPNFDDSIVIKHKPDHDVCFDVMQICNGE